MKNVKEKNKIEKKVLWTLFSLLLAILTVRAITKMNGDMSMGHLINIISEAHKGWMLLGVLSTILFVLLEGLSLRIILKSAGYPRGRKKGLIYSTSDVYFSAITPSATGGQPASAFFMIRDGIPVGITAAVLILNLMMYTISIVILGIVSIIIKPEILRGFGKYSLPLIYIGFACLTILAIIFILIFVNGDRFFRRLKIMVLFLYKKRIIKKPRKPMIWLMENEKEYSSFTDLVRGNNRIVVRVLIINILQRTSQILVPVFVYFALGGKKSHALIIFTKQCLITIAYNFIPIPGAMGISDYLMFDGFSRIMKEHMAYNVELIARGITFYMCVAICGLITLVGYICGSKKNEN